MTRIIAGFAGSLTIVVPGHGTRPTSDRVREAIFSALEARRIVAGARVLDLYAGSGALGLEAASRGAARVTLVDHSTAATAACRKNAARILSAAPTATALAIEVSSQPVATFLAATDASWDLVFIDPPYELVLPELAENLGALIGRLTADAVVVLERSSRDPAPELPIGLELERRKAYGDTTLYWLRAT